MSMMIMSNMFKAQCPKNAIIYNKTLCSCSPGYLFNVTTKSCSFFKVFPSEWLKSSVVKQTNVDENYQKMVAYDSFFLVTILVGLLIWLLMCALLRLGHLGDGQSAWFHMRWWISRLDVTFSTMHWLVDQQTVKKRKTELGGTFSVASWMLFLGLLSALLYQIIARRGTEVYGMKATNSVDLISYTNDLEVTITTISSMTCSQLRGPKTITLDSPGSIDDTIVPFSSLANYSCQNSNQGPVINLRCQKCPLASDYVYISWHFVDIPNKFAATAVGFKFNFTARNRLNHRQYENFVGGTIKNRENLDDLSITYRGARTSMLKFNLFPRVYLNLNGLKLIQPLFHEFRPGTFARHGDELQSSLQQSNNGIINVTVALNFLSSFLVEVDYEKYGPVTFIADVGGLYCISVAIFLLLLTLFESKIKRLRSEDEVLRKVKKRAVARKHWDKLRKYVSYTYGGRLLPEDYSMKERSTGCFKKLTPLERRPRRDIEAELQSLSLPIQDSSTNVLRDSSGLSNDRDEITISVARCTSQLSLDNKIHHVPSLPSLHEVSPGLTTDASSLQKELQNLYEYIAMLRKKLVHAWVTLDALTREASLSRLDSN